MTHKFALIMMAVALALLSACGGDDDAPLDGSATPTQAAPTDSSIDAAQARLRDQLASVLLQQSEVPPGFQGAAAAFSNNEDLAGTDQAELQRLIEIGRQLGADVTFIPTDQVDAAEPAKGGIQSSASVYTSPDGASETFRETVAQARANDWAANFPSLEEVDARELDLPIGDESLWLRVSGLEDCQPLGDDPQATCVGKQRVTIDNVVFRVGRVRAFIMVSSLFPQQAEPDVYASQVEVWAKLVAERAAATFPAN